MFRLIAILFFCAFGSMAGSIAVACGIGPLACVGPWDPGNPLPPIGPFRPIGPMEDLSDVANVSNHIYAETTAGNLIIVTHGTKFLSSDVLDDLKALEPNIAYSVEMEFESIPALGEYSNVKQIFVIGGE